MQDIQLPSPLVYQGKRLVTVEDASVFILNLPQEKLDAQHWRAAHAAFSCALMEPAYLNAALVALELAMTLEALIDPGVLTPPETPSIKGAVAMMSSVTPDAYGGMSTLKRSLG